MTLDSISHHSSGSGVFPALVFVQGSEQKNIVLNRTPFTVGRKVDKDLVIADPRVSRDHAQIMQEGQDFFLVDLGSKHGTFVNGERIQRQKLERGDRLEFGARDSAYILFNPAHATSNTAREFLSQISGIQIKQEATDLEKLTSVSGSRAQAEYGRRARRNPDDHARRHAAVDAGRARRMFF